MALGDEASEAGGGRVGRVSFSPKRAIRPLFPSLHPGRCETSVSVYCVDSYADRGRAWGEGGRGARVGGGLGRGVARLPVAVLPLGGESVASVPSDGAWASSRRPKQELLRPARRALEGWPCDWAVSWPRVERRDLSRASCSGRHVQWFGGVGESCHCLSAPSLPLRRRSTNARVSAMEPP